MTEPVQQPPQARGPQAVVLIVGDDLARGVDPRATERCGQCVDLRQRMPAIAAGLSTGQIAVEMHEQCTGQVARAIRLLACFNVGEIVPAIDDDEAWVVDMAREDLGGNQRRVDHSAGRYEFTRPMSKGKAAGR